MCDIPRRESKARGRLSVSVHRPSDWPDFIFIARGAPASVGKGKSLNKWFGSTRAWGQLKASHSQPVLF